MIKRASQILALLFAGAAYAGQYDVTVSPCTGTYASKHCSTKAVAIAQVYISDNISYYNDHTIFCVSQNRGTALGEVVDNGDHVRGRVYCSDEPGWSVNTGTATWDADEPLVTSEDCEALTADALYQNTGTLTTNYESKCTGGCNFAIDPDQGSTSVTIGSVTLYTGYYRFDGTVCADPQPTDPTVDTVQTANLPVQECTAAGAGQSFCVKADGRQCYTAGSTGKQICWSPTETGTKTEQNVFQIRIGGTSPSSAPSVPGDTPSATGTPITNTTTIGDTSTTTTVQNWVTVNNTEAGPSQGEPTDGSGTASTSGTCDVQPSCSGDLVNCAILAETHARGCALLAKATADTEQSDTRRDAQIAASTALATQYTNALTTELGNGPITRNGIVSNYDGGLDTLDDTGFLAGTRTCPIGDLTEIEFLGGTFTTGFGVICSAMQILAAMILLAAWLQAAWILGRFGGT